MDWVFLDSKHDDSGPEVLLANGWRSDVRVGGDDGYAVDAGGYGWFVDANESGVRTVAQASLPAPTLPSIPNDQAYAVLANFAAARVSAAQPATQPGQPAIDWSARASDFGLKATPPAEKAAPHAWTSEFVLDLGRNGEERNPNDKLRVQVPPIVKASLNVGSLRRGL